MTTSLSAMKHIIFGQISTCNLSGPVGIAETSGAMAQQGAQSFLWFIGMLSAGVGLITMQTMMPTVSPTQMTIVR